LNFAPVAYGARTAVEPGGHLSNTQTGYPVVQWPWRAARWSRGCIGRQTLPIYRFRERSRL
jgi:hypothetical protein